MDWNSNNTNTLDLEGGGLIYVSGGEGPLILFSHMLGAVAWGDLPELMQSCTVVIPIWDKSSISHDDWGAYRWFDPLLDALKADHATLCAWSMAGPSAIRFAASKPARLQNLILTDVVGLGGGLPRLTLRDLPSVIRTSLTGKPTRGYVKAMWRNWLKPGSTMDTTSLVDAHLHFLNSARYGRKQKGTPPVVQLADLLPQIAVPTLIVAGKHSSVMGVEYGAVASTKIPQCKLVICEESGHAPQLEEPAKFQDAVRAFVNGE